MQPNKANKIQEALKPASKITAVQELDDAGKKIMSHSGFAGRRPEGTDPGSTIQITTLLKPTFKERLTGQPRDPKEEVARVIGTLAKLGYLHDPDGTNADHDPMAPQLEHVEEPSFVYGSRDISSVAELPYVERDTRIGRMAVVMNFRDHNPQA